jgi:U3 small nucleolar RNA-associated protein 14
LLAAVTMPKKQKQKAAAALNSDDDSSIASDDAFDSEDERRYGSFFEERDKAKGKKMDTDDSDSDDDKDESDGEEVESTGEEGDEDDDDVEDDDEDDSDADGDGGDYMLSLLDKLDDNKRNLKHEVPHHGLATHTKESEFSASVVKKADLTLDALMGSIQDTAGFGKVQKQLKKVAQGEATSVPMARVVSDRMERKVNYEEQCKEVSQWMTAVQQNRQAETLDFRPKERLVVTQQGLVDGFTPTTDFEKQIHAALQKAGQEDEATILKRENDRLQDDLDANEITL